MTDAIPGLSPLNERRILFGAAILSIVAFVYLKKRLPQSAKASGSGLQLPGDANIVSSPLSGSQLLGYSGNSGLVQAPPHATPLASIMFGLNLANQAGRAASTQSTDSSSFNIFGISLGGIGLNSATSGASINQFSGTSTLADQSQYANLSPSQFDKVIAFENSLVQTYANQLAQRQVVPPISAVAAPPSAIVNGIIQ